VSSQPPFDGERHPFQPLTDVRYKENIFVGQREVGLAELRLLHKEPDGIEFSRFFRQPIVLFLWIQVRELHTFDVKYCFASQIQVLTRCRHYSDMWPSLQQLIDQRRTVHDVLEIVDDQEHLSVAQVKTNLR
jgi:hypothetical protein